MSRYTLLLTSLFFAITAGTGMAQQDQAVSARKSLDLGDLEAAKQTINVLLSSSQGTGDAHAWHLKGWIYKELYLKFPAHDNDSLYREQSLQALVTSMNLDADKKLRKDNKKIALYVVNTFFNDGKKAFDQGQYSEASAHFINYLNHIQQIDTSSLDKNAIFYAGYNAWLAGKSNQAEEYLKQAIALPQPPPLSFVVLSKLSLSAADTVASFGYIEKAAALFPDNKDVAITRANLYLLSKRYKEALPLLEKAMSLDTANAELMVAAASTLERLAEVDSVKEANIEKAIHYYQQALNAEPDNFLANFNLGTIIYNKALEQEKPQTRSSKLNMLLLVKEGEDNASTLKQALPLLEKASTLAPDHREALLALENIYFKLHETEKYKEVRARLDLFERQDVAAVPSTDL